MANMKRSLHELHSLLVQAEKDMGASRSTRRDVLAIKVKGKGTFKKSAGKAEKAASVKGKGKAIANSSSKSKKSAPLGDKCHYCDNVGHWRCNCPKYLDDIKAGRVTPSRPKKHKEVSQG
ncbi:uncharacterized protein LOC141618244 [Silene latifolia]|uniref:uncharacterized protein LOC141618244 n=1 Tax=Silene latifolia TaxID=37657 RepID=UPI003D77EA3E